MAIMIGSNYNTVTNANIEAIKLDLMKISNDAMSSQDIDIMMKMMLIVLQLQQEVSIE